jgi:hypothetical protein
MKGPSIPSAGLFVVLCMTAASAPAQDFQKVYSLAPGARIAVKNVSGDIFVSGYQGQDVQVLAYKEGPDRDLVQIEDQASAQSLSLRPRYPEGTRCNASVRFEIKVPRGLDLNFDSLSNASGDISVEGVKGTVRLRTASGGVEVRQVEGSVDAATASGDVIVQGAIGVVSASTASGDVEVELLRQGTGDEMKFSSASGDVTVKAPRELDADVEMSTASGSLHTDFPLTVEDRKEGHGKKAAGRLGTGSCRLRLSTASGDVKLMR